MTFEGPKQLIGRARHHIDDLQGQIQVALAGIPHTRIVDRDPQTGQNVYKVRLASIALADHLPLVAKDAVSNLRDALDHAVYACACGLGAVLPEKTGFPFARDADGVNGELNSRRLQDIPSEIRAFLAAFQPYEAGNQLLWSLNRIRNTKTHRFLVPLGVATRFGGIGIGSGTITGNSRIGYSKWDAAKNEIEYMRLGPGSTINHQVNVTVNVLFDDVDAVRGKPAVATLHSIASEVERIVRAIEGETARLLGVRAEN